MVCWWPVTDRPRTEAAASLRSPRPTRPAAASLQPGGRDTAKCRSLSPAPSRPRPPQLPAGPAAAHKKSCVESGAAKLYEKAAELRSR